MTDNGVFKREGGFRTRGKTLSASAEGPLISVITVVFNCESQLAACITSVIEQTYQNIEYIIIDGGSTDGTLDVIKRHDDKIAYWASEPDNGIYGAMNRGLDAATGDWIYFLGADDRLYDVDAIRNISGLLHPDYRVIYGSVIYANGKTVKSRLNLITLLHNTVHHQSAFYNVGLFNGWRYDSGLRLIADYELNLRIYLENIPHRRVDNIIAVCNESGQSRISLDLAFAETNRVRNKYLHGIFGILLTFLYSVKFRISRG